MMLIVKIARCGREKLSEVYDCVNIVTVEIQQARFPFSCMILLKLDINLSLLLLYEGVDKTIDKTHIKPYQT